MVNNASLGYAREIELHDALVASFGKGCVYHSPKVYVHKQEKELGDLVVLALPYMIVFQMKWRQFTSRDLCGERQEVFRNRLAKALQKAAYQFTELASSLRQKSTVELPQVWNGEESSRYRFLLELVEYVVPVVVVDFDDPAYSDPDQRFCDIPPVVSNIPSQIKSWGAVHSFLLKDLYRILELTFTVGDFLSWLKERENMVSIGKRSIIGYGELSLFAIYRFNYDSWSRMLKSDCVFLMENDMYEWCIKEHRKEIDKKKARSRESDLISYIDTNLVRTLIEDTAGDNDKINTYLVCQGRLLCCSADFRFMISEKMKLIAQRFAEGDDNMLGSVALADPRAPLQGVAYYFGITSCASEAMNNSLVCAYTRVLKRILEYNREDSVKDVLVVLLHTSNGQIFVMNRRIEAREYSVVK